MIKAEDNITLKSTKSVNDTATTAKNTADSALSQANSAKNTADSAKAIADNTNQYFCHTSTGTDTGAHITEVPQDDFVADPANGGGNLLARSNGIAVRNGLTELATFGATGETIKAEDGTLIAHLGYGAGNAETGTGIAPYYVLGRLNGSPTLGNYSVTEGSNCVASGFCSHAEGNGSTATANFAHAEGLRATASEEEAHAEGLETTASGKQSHAEGYDTTASNYGAHAEGAHTVASGLQSHAEGTETEASGGASHAQGYNTIAQGFAQTVLGILNVPQTYSRPVSTTDHAVIIGNGQTTNARNNALVVTWGGNVLIDIGDYQTAGTTDKALYDAIVALGWDSEVLS